MTDPYETIHVHLDMADSHLRAAMAGYEALAAVETEPVLAERLARLGCRVGVTLDLLAGSIAERVPPAATPREAHLASLKGRIGEAILAKDARSLLAACREVRDVEVGAL